MLDRASRDLSRRSAMNEAAKRRKILSLGREPQEHGMEKIVSREAATDNQKTMAAAHAAGYGSIAPSALDRLPAAHSSIFTVCLLRQAIL